MKWVAAVVFAAAMVFLPAVAGDFYINLATQILIASVFALSLNLLVGFGGVSKGGYGSRSFSSFIACFQCPWLVEGLAFVTG